MSIRQIPPSRILITDDEKDVRGILAVLLKSEGLDSVQAEDGFAALEIVRQGLVDVMLLDIMMPNINGMEVLSKAHELDARLPIILVTGCGTVESAIEAARLYAFSYLTKPFKNDELILTVRMALENRRLHNTSLSSQFQCCQRPEPHALAGQSSQLHKVLADIALIAPTEFTTIISGETGVGKELVARAIHHWSVRRNGPFVPIDCGSIPPTLIESELFGHEKGAFTGADRAKAGSFEIAAHGTLFLDEISNLPLHMQAKLLRALQERQIYRVGTTTPLKLDVRIVAATNENLKVLVDAGKFRRDLFYRLNEFSIVVPPLRERGDDVLWLAQYFSEEFCRELRKRCPQITETARGILLSYSWPGNIRELRNVMRRAVLLAHAQIDPEHLALMDMAPAPTPAAVDLGTELLRGLSLKEIVRHRTLETERQVLLRVLQETGGNLAKAARQLQIDYKTIRIKAKQYQIDRSH